MTHIPGILSVFDPAPGRVAPVLVDSPHSGRDYPADFSHACPRAALEKYEDRYVDELIAAFPALGATVVCAHFPRTYIDANRARDDLSPAQLADPWPYTDLTPAPGDYTARGVGLIWQMSDRVPIYAHAPTSAQVMARITRYYDPYYAALADRAALLKARFGRFYHLNMHSMPPDVPHDIVLGDLQGQSCTPDFRAMLADAFTRHGLRVGFNTPYKGARLTELFGRPERRSESIQIEMNKRLYLRADRLNRHDKNFAALTAVLNDVLAVVSDYAPGLPKTPENDARMAASSSAMETVLPSAAMDVTP